MVSSCVVTIALYSLYLFWRHSPPLVVFQFCHLPRQNPSLKRRPAEPRLDSLYTSPTKALPLQASSTAQILISYLKIIIKFKMDARTAPTTASSNPPSVEIAYKRKCIALKKRLAEVEAENELMRTRNRRGWQYIQKMRLESCLLLERLAKITGMADDAQAGTADPELRARAAAMMSNAAGLNGLAAQGGNGGYLEDETEGSSDEQPPTVCDTFSFALP